MTKTYSQADTRRLLYRLNELARAAELALLNAHNDQDREYSNKCWEQIVRTRTLIERTVPKARKK